MTKLLKNNDFEMSLQVDDKAMQVFENLKVDQLQELLQYAKLNNIPILLEETAKLLFNFVYNEKPKTILEIGTAIGYSGTLLLKASNAHLTTIEKLQSSYEKAKHFFIQNNLINNVQLILNDACVALQDLQKQNKKFDFIFLDGPKGQYINYLPIIKNLLNMGGFLFADNVFFKGLVLSTQPIARKYRTIVVNLRKFLTEIKNDKDFVSMQLDVGDGVLIAKLK